MAEAEAALRAQGEEGQKRLEELRAMEAAIKVCHAVLPHSSFCCGWMGAPGDSIHCVYLSPQAQDDKVEALEGALREKRAAAEVRETRSGGVEDICA